MPKAKKKVYNGVREIIDRHHEIVARVEEIASTCEQENRERSQEENDEFAALMREDQLLQMHMLSAQNANMAAPVQVDSDNVLRERLLRDHDPLPVTIQFMREVTPQTTAALADTGIIPVAEQEMLDPIRKGLIWDKVGISIRHGLAGKLRWPMHGKAYAQFLDEAARLTDSKIDWSKLEMSGHRLGIAIPVTREELEDSRGIVENVINYEAPQAVIDAINAALFCTTTSYKDKDDKDAVRKVYGPFVEAAKTPVQFAGELPTRDEILSMLANVADKIDLKNPCFVMTEGMKIRMRGVKIDTGSGRFLVEGDSLLGYPIFCTSEIGEGNIGFGDWGYQAAGFFGNMSFIVDPYTLARNNSVDFVINNRFGTVTLRKEAFVLGKVKAATESGGSGTSGEDTPEDTK